MKLSDLLVRSARSFPQRSAATCNGQSINYQQLVEWSRSIAEKLNFYSLPAGSRVGLYMENSLEYLAAYWGILAAGFVIVPLDNSSSPETLRFIIDDCSVEGLVVSPAFRRKLPAVIGDATNLKLILCSKENGLKVDQPTSGLLPDCPAADIILDSEAFALSKDFDDNQLAAIFYTSGSAGKSKGVMLSHRNLVSNTIATIEYLRLTEIDSIMTVLPFYYIYGNSLLLTHIASGGRLVIDNRFMYPEVILDEMEKEEVTGFSGVPSNFTIMLGKSTLAKRLLSKLRYFTQAGGAMAPKTTRQLIESFPNKEVYIMYGQTEASPRVTWLPPDRLKDKIGSIGIPLTGLEMDLIDEDGKPVAEGKTGQIIVRGPNVMLGYWNQAEEEREVLCDRTLFTGDLAFRDDEGYYWIIGRSKEIIKSGGNRVSAKEIEDVLLSSPDLIEATVIGLPDDLLGEAITAVVVVRPESEADPKSIKKHCQENLPLHKLPVRIEIVEALPKLQTGKIDRLTLKKSL